MRKYDKDIIEAGNRLNRKALRMELKKGHKKKKKKETQRKRIPKKYETYIKSKYWKERKNKFFKDFGRKCRACGRFSYIQVHHMVYRRQEFGMERDSDLVALCKDCHLEFHEKYGNKGNTLAETYEFIALKKGGLYFKGDIT